MEKIKTAYDDNGNVIVVIPNIIFKNKQDIDWEAVEKYLEQRIYDVVKNIESQDTIYIGKNSQRNIQDQKTQEMQEEPERKRRQMRCRGFVKSSKMQRTGCLKIIKRKNMRRRQRMDGVITQFALRFHNMRMKRKRIYTMCIEED